MKRVQPRKIRNNTKRRVARTLYYFTYNKPIPIAWRKPGRIEHEVLAVLEER